MSETQMFDSDERRLWSAFDAIEDAVGAVGVGCAISEEAPDAVAVAAAAAIASTGVDPADHPDEWRRWCASRLGRVDPADYPDEASYAGAEARAYVPVPLRDEVQS